MFERRCLECCDSGYAGCKLPISLWRSEGEKDRAELSREEPEDVDGESGGVGCRLQGSSNGTAMEHWKGWGEEREKPLVVVSVEIKGMKDGALGAPAPRNDCVRFVSLGS